MLVYHEIEPDKLDSALKNGLPRKKRSDKGGDSTIIETDQLLDRRRPATLKKQGVSRGDSLYVYACSDGLIIDIVDGARRPLAEFVDASQQSVLEIEVDASRCFVSDLDAYDAVKSAVCSSTDWAEIEPLAKSYWTKVKRLDEVDVTAFRRPEIMVTYDVDSSSLRGL